MKITTQLCGKKDRVGNYIRFTDQKIDDGCRLALNNKDLNYITVINKQGKTME